MPREQGLVLPITETKLLESGLPLLSAVYRPMFQRQELPVQVLARFTVQLESTWRSFHIYNTEYNIIGYIILSDSNA